MSSAGIEWPNDFMKVAVPIFTMASTSVAAASWIIRSWDWEGSVGVEGDMFAGAFDGGDMGDVFLKA